MKKLFISVISMILVVFTYSFISINPINANTQKDIKDKRIEQLEYKVQELRDSISLYKLDADMRIMTIYYWEKDTYLVVHNNSNIERIITDDDFLSMSAFIMNVGKRLK